VQCVADSYRSAIRSAAISILTAYFESQDELKDSDENRQEFTKYALDNLRFLYRKADGDNKTISVHIVFFFLALILDIEILGTLSRYIHGADLCRSLQCS
jgi:hypothetical protein